MALIAFNSEQKLIQGEVRKFSRTELEPIAGDIDKNGVFPVEIIKKLSDLGLSSLIVPEKFNGADIDTTSLCIVLEELSKVCASISNILAVNNCLVAFPIMNYAPEQMKEHYLKKLAQGEIGAYSVDLGIDASDANINVTETDGDCLVSGRHDFVLNGETANFFILPVCLTNGKALYLCEDTASIQQIKHQILGMRAAGIVGFEYKDLRLMGDKCLLSADKAVHLLKKIQDYSNIGFSAISLGIAQAAFDASVKYSKERRQFGRAICEFPMVQEMLVDMKTRIEAARFLVYDAAAKFDKGQDYSLSANIARLISSEAAVFSGITAIQVHGGYGYIKDYPVERFLRDAKTVQVLQEPPQDLKSKIAKELLS
jgi:butyryl-CoA dehydrogenase